MNISKKKGIYIENGHRMGAPYLSKRLYSKAIGSLIVVCSDTIIINRRKKVVYLARRRVQPMKGWWELGGRRFSGETACGAARRNFIRETSLIVAESRFSFVQTVENIWGERKENKKNIGKHDLISVFSINLTAKEREYVTKNLDQKEYYTHSLEAFDKKRLIQEKVHLSLIDTYCKIFE